MVLHCWASASTKAFNISTLNAPICRSFSRTDLLPERRTNCSFQMPFSFAIWQGYHSHGLPITLKHKGWDKVILVSCWQACISDYWQCGFWGYREVKPAFEMAPRITLPSIHTIVVYLLTLYSKSPTYESVSCELSKMQPCVPSIKIYHIVEGTILNNLKSTIMGKKCKEKSNWPELYPFWIPTPCRMKSSDWSTSVTWPLSSEAMAEKDARIHSFPGTMWSSQSAVPELRGGRCYPKEEAMLGW